MVDVDHFKRVNDSYGHAVGDKALCHVANTLTKTTRSMDFISRFGGEEFVIVMPNSMAADAFIVARRIQEHLREHDLIVDDDTTIELRVSIGCAIFPEDGSNGEELVEHADTALYQAKEGGRNRIVMYSEHQPDDDEGISTIGSATLEL
jgi:diguanylate cyclase (GGDEF)-like protein